MEKAPEAAFGTDLPRLCRNLAVIDGHERERPQKHLTGSGPDRENLVGRSCSQALLLQTFSAVAARAAKTAGEGKIVEAETVSQETEDAEADGEAEAVEAEAEAEGEARLAEVFAGNGVTEEAAAE